jgi:hypothetical protein
MSQPYKAMPKRILRKAASMVFAAVALAPTLAAQTPIRRFTATTDNVHGTPDSIRIDVLRWSTDAERDQLMSAWNMTNGAGRTGRGDGRGAARGGRGAGRGRGEETPAQTPESSFADALQRAATVGYLWSSEVEGYALRYAGKLTLPDGRERIIVITDRRLGALTDPWTPVGSVPPNSYTFSVIELRVNSKGDGEGKISLTGKVSPDAVAKIVAIENYADLPVTLKNLKAK